jgi:hypothetical protein
VPTEELHFPVVPHRAAGADCDGSIVHEVEGHNVTLKCNVCGAVVGKVQVEILKALEQAIADSFVISKFDEMGATRVFTSISEECQRGECEKCPGHFHRPDAGDEPVFCIHACHEFGEREPDSIN